MNNKNKFIGKFVNEMYAILIGIGISHIVFLQNLNLRSIPETLMALFVISVALLYWWDWSEHIENDVVTTKREFIIDFAILLTIVMLFAHFYDFPNLTTAFLILGILDFIWVLNYIYEAKKTGTHIASYKGWIFEKIIVILIYTASWLMVSKIFTISILQIGIIILSFVLVRNIGFIYVKTKKKYFFTKATFEDIVDIVEINNSYFKEDASKKGVLLKKLHYKAIETSIRSEKSYFFLAKQTSGKVVGYIELSKNVDNSIFESLDWEKSDGASIILPSKHFYIEQVAVKSGYNRKGIGSYLYKNIFDNFPDYTFTAFVMNKPIQNDSSIQFHLRNGFRDAGTYRASQFMGMSNYESSFFVRQYDKVNKLTETG